MLQAPVVDVPNSPYCGPTAISAITGAPVSKIRAMVRRIRNAERRKFYGPGWKPKRKQPVAGMYSIELLLVMKRLGYNFKTANYGSAPKETLREFCEDKAHMGPFIVQVTGHYVAVSNGMICDTFTRTPIPWQQYPKLRSRVRNHWRF